MNLPENRLCTGCSACVLACGRNALSLNPDSHGFLHPTVNEDLCPDCKMCEEACPLKTPSEKSKTETVLIARAKDTFLESSSSSGGAFSVLAQKVLKDGGVVYGAGFDENFNVCHKRVDNSEDLKLLRGSKYVQSYFINAASKAKEDLKSGKPVLFSGTPCQIAAISNICKNIRGGKLYTVDFICHGVVSPALFEKYRDFVSGGKKITAISFRDKTEGWRRYSMKIDFCDGTHYRKTVVEDPYLVAFVQGISHRRSCNNCAFLGVNRASDITLADAWGQADKCVELNDGKGVSLVLVNSQRGAELFSEVKEDYIYTELDLSVLGDIKSLNTSSNANPLRNKYYKDMHKLNFDKLTAKYCGTSLNAKIRRFVAKKFMKLEK